MVWMLRGLSAALLAMVVIAGVSPAQAQSATPYSGQSEAGSTVVRFDTLRVATEETVAIVADRIARAVRAASRRARRAPAPTASNETGVNEYGLERLAQRDGGMTIPLFGYDSGYSAGEDVPRFSVWANGGFTWVENDFSSTAFDGNVITALVGADYWVTEKILIGAIGGYDRTDVDTSFNQGELESDGFTAGLYLAYLLGDNFSLEGLLGHTWTDSDMDRTSLAGAKVTGSTNARRLFGSLGFSGNFQVDNFLLSPTVRHLVALETIDSFTESDGTRVGEETTDLGVLQFGGRASYLFEKFEPYVSALIELETFSTDTQVASGPKPRDDRADLDVSAGLDFFPTDFISGGVELNHKFERENFDETTVSGTLTFVF